MSRNATPKRPKKFLQQATTDYGLPLDERWLVVEPPISGESLASWFWRQSLAMGCRPLVLAEEIEYRAKFRAPTLCRNLDAVADDPLLCFLSGKTGIRLSSMVGLSASRVLGGGAIQKLGRKWLLRYTTSNGFVPTTQLCPDCLTEDPVPFLRRNWRLGWCVTCLKHEALLVDRCWSCKAPFSAEVCKAEGLLARNCPECHAKLDSSPRTWSLPPEIVDMQRKIEIATKTREWVLGGRYIRAKGCLVVGPMASACRANTRT